MVSCGFTWHMLIMVLQAPPVCRHTHILQEHTFTHAHIYAFTPTHTHTYAYIPTQHRRRLGIMQGDVLEVIAATQDHAQRTHLTEVLRAFEIESLTHMSIMPGVVDLCALLDAHSIPRYDVGGVYMCVFRSATTHAPHNPVHCSPATSRTVWITFTPIIFPWHHFHRHCHVSVMYTSPTRMRCCIAANNGVCKPMRLPSSVTLPKMMYVGGLLSKVMLNDHVQHMQQQNLYSTDCVWKSCRSVDHFV